MVSFNRRFNPIMRVRTNRDTRSFLFVDSLVLSAAVAPDADASGRDEAPGVS